MPRTARTPTRTCRACGKDKPHSDFPWAGRWRHTCHVCLHERQLRLAAHDGLSRDVLLVLTKYKMTGREFQRLLIAQAGRCGICAKPLEKICIDHDHATGKVRGLLCPGCNTGIGLLGDTAESVARAVQYLERARQ